MQRLTNKTIKSLEMYMNKIGKNQELWTEKLIEFLEIKDLQI